MDIIARKWTFQKLNNKPQQAKDQSILRYGIYIDKSN